MQDKRYDLRQRMLKSGSIVLGNGAVIDCILRNLSATGACLEIESPVGIPNTFRLAVRSDAVHRECAVMWRSARRLGVKFL